MIDILLIPLRFLAALILSDNPDEDIKRELY